MYKEKLGINVTLHVRLNELQYERESKVMIVSKTEELMALLNSNHGYLKTSDVMRLGISRAYLGEFVKAQGLRRVTQGLYMSMDAWDDGIYELQVRYPKAVFSHETALYLLKMAEREPSQFSLTLESSANSAALSKQDIKVYKVKEALVEMGMMEVKTPTGHMVRVYNTERTICDLFRSRRNIEIQDFQEAIKDYVRLKEKNLPLLMRYAKEFSVEKIIQLYLEVLL